MRTRVNDLPFKLMNEPSAIPAVRCEGKRRGREGRGGQGYESLLGTRFPFRRKSPTSPSNPYPRMSPLSLPHPFLSPAPSYRYCATVVMQRLQKWSQLILVSMVPNVNQVDAWLSILHRHFRGSVCSLRLCMWLWERVPYMTVGPSTPSLSLWWL